MGFPPQHICIKAVLLHPLIVLYTHPLLVTVKWGGGLKRKNAGLTVAHAQLTPHPAIIVYTMCTLPRYTLLVRGMRMMMIQFHLLTGTDVENDKQNFWTLLVEIYSAFSKYYLLLVLTVSLFQDLNFQQYKIYKSDKSLN